MKKFLVAIAAMVISFSAMAEDNWDFISFTFAPGLPEEVYEVYGVKIGAPIGSGDKFVVGAELSVIGSTTREVYGVQGAFIYNGAERVDGLQACGFFNYAQNVNGVQFSIVNVAEDSAFQIGLVNIIKNSPLMVFPIINVKF